MKCLASSLIVMAAITALPTFAAETDVSKCTEHKAWQDAYNKGDAAAVASLYAPDGIEVTPTGIRTGQAAVKERVENQLKGSKTVTITVAKCDIDGPIKWSSGEWTADTSNGKIGGYWTSIIAKHGDVWKIRNLTFTVTAPPAPSKS